MTVSFSSSVLLSSVSPSDFTIDGNDATGVTVVDDHTVDLHLPDDLQRHPQRVDQRPRRPPGHRRHARQLHLRDRRRAAGRRLELDRRRGGALAGSADRGRHVQQADSALVGQHAPTSCSSARSGASSYTPSSISFDPTDTILTITYSNLPTDAYQFVLDGRARPTS